MLFFKPSHDVLQRFIVAALGPALGLLTISLIFIALEGVALQDNEATAGSVQDFVLAAGFAGIPLMGFIGAKISHGPFVDRYFLSSVAGYAIFLSFALSRTRVGKRVVAGLMVLMMVEDLAGTAYLARNHRLVLTEPTTGFILTTTPSTPMERYRALLDDRQGRDVLVLSALDYFYFVTYAPPERVRHLAFLANPTDVNTRMFESLVSTAGLRLNLTTADSFMASRSRFVVYAPDTGPLSVPGETFIKAGYRLESITPDANGVAYEYAK